MESPTKIHRDIDYAIDITLIHFNYIIELLQKFLYTFQSESSIAQGKSNVLKYKMWKQWRRRRKQKKKMIDRFHSMRFRANLSRVNERVCMFVYFGSRCCCFSSAVQFFRDRFNTQRIHINPIHFIGIRSSPKSI